MRFKGSPFVPFEFGTCRLGATEPFGPMMVRMKMQTPVRPRAIAAIRGSRGATAATGQSGSQEIDLRV